MADAGDDRAALVLAPPVTAATALDADGGTGVARPFDHTAELAAGFFARYAGTTLRNYRLNLAAFARWLGVPLDQLAAVLLERGAPGVHVDVERYRAYLRDERHASPATINTNLAAIRSIVRFLRRAQLCTWTLDVSSERARAYRDTRGPGIPAVRALLAAAKAHRDPRKAARDAAIVRLLADRGLRRGEVVSLDLEHVEWAARTSEKSRTTARSVVAILVRGKGSADRERLTLPPKTAAALATWILARGDDDGPLFISLDPGAGRIGRGGRDRAMSERLTGEGVARIVAALARRAGVEGGVRPHGIRHTAITALLDAGSGLRDTQRFSRHVDPRTLMRYDDNRTDMGGELARVLSEMV